jgi:type VII secretion protein EccB
MPTDPTTTSQVQAYRFVLRRMESALVRKDAVMLHEPMRHHLRATAVGVVLSVLGLAAFVVLGHGSLGGDEVSANDIMRGDPSDAYYVVVNGDQPKLLPVPNLTSARLVVAAVAPGREVPSARRMSDTALERYGRLAASDYPGIPAQLPTPTNLIRGVWSVCDAPAARQAADPRSPLSTTVLIQEQASATQALTDEQALLVAEQNTGSTYLARRAGLSQIDLAVRKYYRWDTVVPRKISASLFNAIPKGHPLVLPIIPSAPSLPELPNVKIGEVVRVNGVEPTYYLLLPRGKQQVERPVADLILSRRGTTLDFTPVTPDVIGRVPDVPQEDQFDVEGFPARAPQIVKNTDASAACLTWQAPKQPPVVSLNPDGLPLAQGEIPVQISSAAITRAASGQAADYVVLKPGKGALVRSVAEPGQSSRGDPIFLITDQGVRYGVPSTQVAGALWLGEATTPVPDSILKLLPIGASLDPQRALAQISPELARELAGSRTGG